jgi:hypothetical protein
MAPWQSRRVLRLIAIAVLVGIPVVSAAAPCDPVAAAARSTAIRRHLDDQARRARLWDWGWGVGFAVVAAGQGALIAAEWHPIEDYDDDIEAALTVGAVQSVLSALPHAVMPLKIVRPPAPTDDACADVAAAERALDETAGHQRTAFYLNHAGGVAFAVGGLLVLGLGYDTWEEGWKSVAVSVPIGLILTYTQPRGSWKAARSGRFAAPGPATSLRLAPTRGPGFTGLALTGAF